MAGRMKKEKRLGLRRCRLWGQTPLFVMSIKEYPVLSNPGNQAGGEEAFCFFHSSATPTSTRRPTPARQQLSLNIQLNLSSASCQHPGSPERLCGCILSSAACWLSTLLMSPQRARFVACREEDICVSGGSPHRCWTAELQESGQGHSRSLGKPPRPWEREGLKRVRETGITCKQMEAK